MQVRLLLSDEVAGESEHVSAQQRRPPRTGEVAAQQKSRPRVKRRHQDGGNVVRHHRAEDQRERRQRKSKPRNARRPREVHTIGRPNRMRNKRIHPMQHRVRPPRKRPDVNLWIETTTEIRLVRMGQERRREEKNRHRQIRAERGDTREMTSTATHADHRDDSTPPSPFTRLSFED